MDGGVVFIMMVVIAGIAISIHQSKKTDEAWSMAARALHLMHQPGGFMRERRISGIIDGCHVVIETVTRGSGKSSRKYTRYSVAYPKPLRLGLSLRKQGFLNGVAKAFGAQDIELGDPTFDSMVMIKGVDPVQIARFLTPHRRGLVLRMMAQYDDLEINDAGLVTESSGQENSFQILIRKIQRLVEFVHTMTDDNDPTSRSQEAVANPTPIRKEKWKPKPKSDSPAPAKPDPVPEPQAVIESVPQQGTIRSEGIHLSASEVGRALFTGQRGIAEIERTFAAEHANRMIEGRGILRNWKNSNFDFVFGLEPCVKATLSVPLGEAGAHGLGSFEVVLRLPAGTDPRVIGEEMFFQGRLLKADGLMRQVFARSE